MARIFPFSAYRYSSRAGSISELVTQPYDKISPEMQEGYYGASPHNVIRLIKGKQDSSDDDSNNVYTRAAATLDQWIADGVLEREAKPALFPYFQEFSHPETGETFVRKGFIGLTEAVDYSAGIVHGHELTHSGPKLDRLRLTRHSRAHFGQLFMLYDDPESAIDARLDRATAGAPLLSVGDEFDVTHTLWKIDDPSEIAEIQTAMETKKLLVADGHHRYETALAYAKENPDIPGAGKVMMTFVNMSAPGLVVLATHRVLGGLPDFDGDAILSKAAQFFDIEHFRSAAELQQRLESAAPRGSEKMGTVPSADSTIADFKGLDEARSGLSPIFSLPLGRCAIGAVLQGNVNCLLTGKKEAINAALGSLTPKERGLDVVVLHKLLLDRVLGVSEEDVKELKNIRYIRGPQAAVNEVQDGSAQVAFLLRPVSVHDVAEISFSGGVMPQKSTDFYPKLLAGLTIYRFG